MLKSNNEENDGKIKINPYNVNNKLINKDDLQAIFNSVGVDNIKINDLSIYQLAFSHKSYCTKKQNDINDVEIAEKPDNALELQPESNERIEYLGDSIISSVIAKYLFDRFSSEDEGFLTRMRTKLVNGEALGNFACKIGLNPFLLLSRHVEERCNGRNNYRILEDAFESFIGAIFLDSNNVDLNEFYQNLYHNHNKDLIQTIKNQINHLNIKKKNKEISQIFHNLNLLEQSKLKYNNDFSGPGYQICENFIINIIENNVDFTELILKDTNYKDQLLRYFQHNFQITPKYIETNCEGPPHNRIFTMSVLGPNGNIIGTGSGKSKKKAEQKASKFALINFGKIIEDDDSSSEN